MGLRLAVDNTNKEYCAITGLWLAPVISKLKYCVVNEAENLAYCLRDSRFEALEYILENGLKDVATIIKV